MELPDFSNFEIEDCELTSFQIETGGKDIHMKFKCPVSGWRWKRYLFEELGALIFPRSVFLDYEVELRFLDTSQFNGSYIDPRTKAVSPNLFEHGFLILADFRFFQTASGRARAYMEFDEGNIEFEFGDCIQREIKKYSKDL
ncbi:MAG: hypothetical protein WA071_08630 [Undibacterium umbellatum]|uniref:hypothetical protein n=1 Tax=Undibacterium umbellatum TaxID=2762300 RepID=UPI003BB5F495